jgi:hypothetical protein
MCRLRNGSWRFSGKKSAAAGPSFVILLLFRAKVTRMTESFANYSLHSLQNRASTLKCHTWHVKETIIGVLLLDHDFDLLG